MHLAVKRQHVVLAEREDVDVADDDHLVVLLVENRLVDQRRQVGLVALREEEKRVGGALRRLEQALARRILAELLQNGSVRSGQLAAALLALLGALVGASLGADTGVLEDLAPAARQLCVVTTTTHR